MNFPHHPPREARKEVPSEQQLAYDEADAAKSPFSPRGESVDTDMDLKSGYEAQATALMARQQRQLLALLANANPMEFSKIMYGNIYRQPSAALPYVPVPYIEQLLMNSPR